LGGYSGMRRKPVCIKPGSPRIGIEENRGKKKKTRWGGRFTNPYENHALGV